ncbi:MAG: hypothetical protein JKX85_06310 [Phycisphaeraceae bacterium]|nr:hypothetical protein [Phycisphaeraceae bacterium]
MAIYIRPNYCLFIVAQSVPLEKQQQLVGLFWALALAVILLFLFVGVMMALFRVIRRRMRLNELEQSSKRTVDLPDPWDESAKRMQTQAENSEDWDSDNPQSWDKPVDNDDEPKDHRH